MPVGKFMAMRKGLLGLGVLLLLAVPASDAFACPACTDSNQGQKVIPVLLGFMGLPFLVFGVGLWAVRRQAQGKVPPPIGGATLESEIPTAVDAHRLVFRERSGHPE